MQVFERN